MNVAIDIDGTITALPLVFSVLSKGLRLEGHKVIIVTFRLEPFRKGTEEELASLGIEYDELFMAQFDRPVDPSWKVEIAIENNVGAFFEDAKEVLMLLPKSIQPVWIVPNVVRNG